MLEEKNNTKSNSTMMMMDEKRNRIQVSNTKRPLFFYLNLAKVLSFFLFRHCPRKEMHTKKTCFFAGKWKFFFS